MKRFLHLIIAGCALALSVSSVPNPSFAQSATKAVSTIKVNTANQLLIPASEVKVNGYIYAESGVVVDSGKSILFKISATGVVASTAPIIRTGTGSPEGVVVAPIGSIFLRLDGSTSTTLYVKTANTTSSGWTAK